MKRNCDHELIDDVALCIQGLIAVGAVALFVYLVVVTPILMLTGVYAT